MQAFSLDKVSDLRKTLYELLKLPEANKKQIETLTKKLKDEYLSIFKKVPADAMVKSDVLGNNPKVHFSHRGKKFLITTDFDHGLNLESLDDSSVVSLPAKDLNPFPEGTEEARPDLKMDVSLFLSWDYPRRYSYKVTLSPTSKMESTSPSAAIESYLRENYKNYDSSQYDFSIQQTISAMIEPPRNPDPLLP